MSNVDFKDNIICKYMCFQPLFDYFLVLLHLRKKLHLLKQFDKYVGFKRLRFFLFF
jgi:hypothetical protein